MWFAAGMHVDVFQQRDDGGKVTGLVYLTERGGREPAKTPPPHEWHRIDPGWRVTAEVASLIRREGYCTARMIKLSTA
jgi:hypothetical protein